MKNLISKKNFLIYTLISYAVMGIYSIISTNQTYDTKEFLFFLQENPGIRMEVKNPIYLHQNKGSIFVVDNGKGVLETKELFISDDKEDRAFLKNLLDSEKRVVVSFERTAYLDPLHRPKSFLFFLSSMFLMGFLVLTFLEKMRKSGNPTQSSEDIKFLSKIYKNIFRLKLNIAVASFFAVIAILSNLVVSTSEWNTETVKVLFDQKKSDKIKLVNPVKNEVANTISYFIEFKGEKEFLKKNTLTIPADLVKELRAKGVEVDNKSNRLSDIYHRFPKYMVYLAFFSFMLVAGSLAYRELEKDKEKYTNSFTANEKDDDSKNEKKQKLTFDDVAGIDEVREQIEEVVQLFRDSSKVVEMGGKMPRGVILNGPPGTGKTLLAKVAASESNASFIHASGSEFVEMYVGVGARRVRDLFERAKKSAPCIVFIDEIDAVAGRRGIDQNSEREQTLNEILVQMDGFNTKENILVMAATNQIEKLDPAILRPGRFDRQISVFLPDAKGREQILRVYLNKTKFNSVNIKKIARSTSGFSGADLANLVNEAILYAARNKKDKISDKDLMWAKDKIQMGSERKIKIDPEEVKRTAYHEIGHAFVAKKLNLGKIVSVSVVPRGRALGVTQLESEDAFSLKKDKAIEQIAMLMAGRVCESIYFNELSTGASNDLQRAYSLAKSMVSSWGMSKLGPLGLDEGSYRSLSEGMKQKIEEGSLEILKEAEALAHKIISEDSELVNKLSLHLLKKETLSSKEFDVAIESAIKKGS